MKTTYFGKEKNTKKLITLINNELDTLEKIGEFGPNPDGFLEKYADPYFDTFRETGTDYEVGNAELLESFEVAYGYLLHLRYWVGIENDYLNGTL